MMLAITLVNLRYGLCHVVVTPESFSQDELRDLHKAGWDISTKTITYTVDGSTSMSAIAQNILSG